MTETEKMYREHGICIKCGHNSARPKRLYCFDCADKRAEYNRIYYIENMEQIKEYKKEQYRTKYEYRKANGLCIACGKRPPDEGKVRCRHCLAKNRKSQIERSRRTGVLPSFMRGDGEYCEICCKPKCSGQKICDDCRAKLIEAQKKRKKPDNSNHPWRRLNDRDVKEIEHKKKSAKFGGF